MIDFDPVRTIVSDLLAALELALPILQEAVRAHLLSGDPTVRIALERIASAVAKARVKPA